jgi:hypothetical protein
MDFLLPRCGTQLPAIIREHSGSLLIRSAKISRSTGSMHRFCTVGQLRRTPLALNVLLPSWGRGRRTQHASWAGADPTLASFHRAVLIPVLCAVYQLPHQANRRCIKGRRSLQPRTPCSQHRHISAPSGVLPATKSLWANQKPSSERPASSDGATEFLLGEVQLAPLLAQQAGSRANARLGGPRGVELCNLEATHGLPGAQHSRGNGGEVGKPRSGPGLPKRRDQL